MVRGVKRILRRVRSRVNEEIDRSTDRESLYGRGLASEGYSGGYRDALDDVMLALDGAIPNRRGWWRDECERQ